MFHQKKAKAQGVIRQRLAVFTGLLWLGMIVGISFVATPLKFQAPGVTLGIGLEIGRLVFSVFNKIEIAFAVLLAVIVLSGPKRDKSLLALGAACLALAIQTLWLLPSLIDRIQMVIEGHSMPASLLHSIYVGLEVTKVLALAVYGFQNSYHSTAPGTKT